MRRVLLAVVWLFSTLPVSADWTTEEPAVSNRLEVETAMQVRGLLPETSSALVAEITSGPLIKKYDRIQGSEHFVPSELTRVSLVAFADSVNPITRRTWYSESGQICTDLAGTVSESARHLETIRAYGSREVTGTQLFMSQAAEGDMIFTWLQPGEQVTLVSASGESRKAERIELTQKGRKLTVDSTETGRKACFSPE